MHITDVMATALILVWSCSGYAFLDFIAKKAEDVAQAAVYADAVSQLLEEIDDKNDASTELNYLRSELDKIRHETNEVSYVGTDIQRLLKGPDITSQRLDQNIRSTTDYIRRSKRMLLRSMALGTQGATALNTMETNVALNEIQKNQQIQILQIEEQKLAQAQKEHEENKNWGEFISKERAMRHQHAQGPLP